MSTPPSNTNDREPKLISVPEMRYQTSYILFVFVSSMDIMLTWLILLRGGSEVNPIAKLVIDAWGLPGAIGFKFALSLFVIISCEVVGRKRDRLGRALITAGILISGFPVVWSLTLLTLHWLGSAPAG